MPLEPGTSRGVAYQLGEHEYFLLMQCDGRRSPVDVRTAFENQFHSALTRDDLNEYLRMAQREKWFLAAEKPPSVENRIGEALSAFDSRGYRRAAIIATSFSGLRNDPTPGEASLPAWHVNPIVVSARRF